MRTLALLCSLSACTGVIVEPASPTTPDEPTVPVDPTPPGDPDPIVRLPAAVACDGVATGRSYRGFAGEALDADRLPLAARQDIARVRDGSDLFTHYDGAGIHTPVTLSDAQTFGLTQERWAEVDQASFASVYRAYALAFAGCLNAVKHPLNYHPFGHGDFAAAPNATSAPRQCQVMGARIWWRAMNDDELAACVEHALELPALEPDVQRQWAYLCASVAASAPFLSF